LAGAEMEENFALNDVSNIITANIYAGFLL
jgi:hypothetical protein